MQLMISCLIGISSLITPQAIDDYKSCLWFSAIAEQTKQAHHAIDQWPIHIPLQFS